MTIEEAKQLKYREDLHYNYNNTYSKCNRWRVNGKVKTWKRDINRVQVPIKSGLKGYGYLTQFNSMHFHKESECNIT